MSRRRVARAGIRVGRVLIGSLVLAAVVLLYLTVFTRAALWRW
jgi:hypothetical protein